MASIVYTLFSMAQVASLHCSVRREISPCTCAPHDIKTDTVYVSCDGVGSFNQVVDALQNKFNPDWDIWLRITHSQLEDLETRTFGDMNVKIKNLKLNYNQLRTLPESSFRNLSYMESLSLSDNNFEEIPRRILNHMPRISTLDGAKGKIKKISADDFRTLKFLRHLILVSNEISTLEKGSLPSTIRYLHLGRNNLTSLNGTLRELNDMEVLFLNENNLTSLDDELPAGSKQLMTIIAHHNKLQRIPQDVKTFTNLDSIYFSDNEIRSLDGAFKHARAIHNIFCYNNKIEYLAEDEFLEADKLETLDLAGNSIRSLNNSLLPLRDMRICNFSRNHIVEFSLDEIKGLQVLRVMDLSYNKIEKLTGRVENVVESDFYMQELRLAHNFIKSLDGAIIGLNKLRVLNLGYNLLNELSPDDLIGLEELEMLDISHNNLQTLEETSKTFLPKLEKLNASHNNLTKLERDFHGLPILCFADLSNNHISYIAPDLVSKTRCSSHGVVNKLEVLLQENPILCNEDLPQLTGLMEAQETRLLGIAHCIVPKEQIPIKAPTVVIPIIPIIPAILTQDILPQTILQSPPGIVQVIVPAPIVLSPKAMPMTAPEPIQITTPSSVAIPILPFVPFVPSSTEASTLGTLITQNDALTNTTNAPDISSTTNESTLVDVIKEEILNDTNPLPTIELTTQPHAEPPTLVASLILRTAQNVGSSATTDETVISPELSWTSSTAVPVVSAMSSATTSETENFVSETLSIEPQVESTVVVPDPDEILYTPEDPPETLPDIFATTK